MNAIKLDTEQDAYERFKSIDFGFDLRDLSDEQFACYEKIIMAASQIYHAPDSVSSSTVVSTIDRLADEMRQLLFQS